MTMRICSYDKCKFSKSSGKSIPVYLVDEEIYAKCPTVVDEIKAVVEIE